MNYIIAVEHQLLQSMNLQPDELEMRKEILQKKHAEELKEFDVGIIMKLDQKVSGYISFPLFFGWPDTSMLS